MYYKLLRLHSEWVELNSKFIDYNNNILLIKMCLLFDLVDPQHGFDQSNLNLDFIGTICGFLTLLFLWYFIEDNLTDC